MWFNGISASLTIIKTWLIFVGFLNNFGQLFYSSQHSLAHRQFRMNCNFRVSFNGCFCRDKRISAFERRVKILGWNYYTGFQKPWKIIYYFVRFSVTLNFFLLLWITSVATTTKSFLRKIVAWIVSIQHVEFVIKLLQRVINW